MIIKINVSGHINIPISKILSFQGDLKKLSEKNHSKLRNEILADGFNFAPHIWNQDKKYFILDGHQRIYVMKQLKKEGYGFKSPDGTVSHSIPCNIVIADDVDSAKRKVLQAISQYGKLDDTGFKDFIDGVSFKLDDFDFDFPDFVMPGIQSEEPDFEFNDMDNKEKHDDYRLIIEFDDDESRQDVFDEMMERGFKVRSPE